MEGQIIKAGAAGQPAPASSKQAGSMATAGVLRSHLHQVFYKQSTPSHVQ